MDCSMHKHTPHLTLLQPSRFPMSIKYKQDTHVVNLHNYTPMHRLCTFFDHPIRLKFLSTHIPLKPISFLSGQRSCVAHTSTNRTHNPKRDTKATTFRKTFTFAANQYLFPYFNSDYICH